MPDYRKLFSSTDPVFVLFLGLCPAVGAAVGIKSALAIGIAALLIMFLSAVCMALLKNALSEGARLTASILITAFFASAVQMAMNALLPGAFSMMGIYLAVIAVDVLSFSVVGKADSVPAAAKDALLTGLYFTAAAVVLGAVRMLLGSGILGGFKIAAVNTVSGGLVLFAIELAVINSLSRKASEKASAGEGE